MPGEGTSTIRVFDAADAGAVARLFVRVFDKGPEQSIPQVAAYFQRLYLENPWVDPGMPSLVVEHDGAVAGFMGVVPMPVRIDGVSLRVAVGGNLMVDRSINDPMAAPRLLRRYFSGTQDLAFTDTANELALRMWTGLGGSVSRFHSMRWLMPLRIGALGLAGAQRHDVAKRLTWLGRPFVRPVDRLGRGRLHPGEQELDVRPATIDHIRGFIASVGSRNYAHVDTDASGFEWLIGMCTAKQQFGWLRTVAFVDRAGRDAGVAMYYPNRDGLGQVVLLLAKEGSHEAVLAELARDAAAHGSAALVGQADPRLLVALGDRVAAYVQRNEFVTVRPSASDEARAAASRIASGDVSLNRLVGEWWTRMQGDTF